MKNILLTKGGFALVDDADFKYLNQSKWSVNTGGYAVTRINREKVYMHRVINETPEGFHTDHINRNKLDNRRSNLRTATPSENALNSKLNTNNRSGHKGVYWYERYKKWEVYININKKRIYLNRYANLEDAIATREKAELLYAGV